MAGRADSEDWGISCATVADSESIGSVEGLYINQIRHLSPGFILGSMSLIKFSGGYFHIMRLS